MGIWRLRTNDALSMHHDVHKILLDRMKVREERLRRVDTISNEKKTQPWELGEDFKDAQSKWRAKSSVLDEIEVRSGKQIKKAQAIISGVVSDLSKENTFDDIEILSSKTKSQFRTMERSIASASSVIFGMTKSFNLGTARILTAVSVVLVPQSTNGSTDAISRRAFCDMIGINRQSKYVDAGFRNRALYDAYLDLEGEI